MENGGLLISIKKEKYTNGVWDKSMGEDTLRQIPH